MCTRLRPHQRRTRTSVLLWYSCAYLDRPRPAERVVRIIQSLRVASDSERLFCLDHYRQFICGVLSEACFYRPRLGSVVDSSPVQGVGAYLDSSPASEVAADVVEYLVTVDVAVIVWDGYG